MKTINNYISEALIKNHAKNNLDTGLWVDLDLPSGKLWTKYSVGAKKETEIGEYFAWAEIEPKKDYNWITYKWVVTDVNGRPTKVKKYGLESKLKPEDDIINVTYGGDSSLPSLDDVKELKNHTKFSFERNFKGSGINGLKCTSKKNSNKYLFIPFGGTKEDDYVADKNEEFAFWTNEKFNGGKAMHVMGTKSSFSYFDTLKCDGLNCFGVKNKK